ncbi:MAG: 30S ribosomal protein S12 methylthiotransferase RimO [Bacteroidales bacterium]|jgi:ribosomal protein S12 methylthiotransferase|nr:30S ribosomal protein S12 methylthiotransferase RimO [Bacteroidales bacterium]
MSLKINIITLGCSKNLVDSEFLAGSLQKAGFKIEFDNEKKTGFYAVIINTCGFIDAAKEEAIDTILSICEQKKQGNVQRIIVCGCLINRYRNELQKEIIEVDAYFGTAQWKEITEYLQKTLAVANLTYQIFEERRFLSTPKHYAYLKISEGCDRHCSFCAIPIIRGKNISRKIEELVQETEVLVKQGVKEIILIAQDTTYYGVDLYGKRALTNLIKELAKIKDLMWIRLQYTYPNQFPMEIIDLMKTEKKLCRYIDMPLQHINSSILRSMKRQITGENTLKLVEKIRILIPEIAFRTTFIVGYCGETKQQFDELKTFVKEMKFDRMGAFKYSPQEGTEAYLLEDSVSEMEKERRLNAITKIQQAISYEKNQAKIGKVFTVLIDREELDYFVGRTEFDSPEVDNEVLMYKSKTSNACLTVGSFILAKIIDALEFDLIAEALPEK